MATNSNNNQDYLNSYLQRQADQAGISTDAMSQLLQSFPMSYQAAPGQYGNYGGGQAMENPSLGQAIATIKAATSGGGSGNQPMQRTQNVGPVSGLTQDAATNLGAWALGQIGLSGPMGAYAVYNPTPGQIPQGSKGGVSQVPSPTTSNAIPELQGGGLSVAGIGGKNPSLLPATSSGPPAGTPTPSTPANAAVGGAVATPWASAPAAPGATAQPTDWHAIAAHNQGLEDAGRAAFSHLTGMNPHDATPDDITGFHNQLQSALANATPFGQAPAGAANYTAGVQPGVATTGATPGAALGVTPPPGMGGPKLMSSGGPVPGQGNGDIVPALLTPGEYVLNRQQVAQIFGGRTPQRMQEGGFVWDQENKKKPAPETQRQKITPPGSPPAAPGQAQATPSQSGQSSGSAASDTPSSNQGYWSNMVRQAQAAQALNSQGASGGGYNVPGGGYIGQSPGAGQSGYMYPNQAAATAAGDVGTGPGGAGPTAANSVAAGADIASSLTSALGKAADAYAKSIKEWNWEKKDFGEGGTPNYQTTNFQQEQV